MLYNAKIDVDAMEHVDLVASGYEWICPKCDKLNKVIEVTDVVECSECEFICATNPPEHALS